MRGEILHILVPKPSRGDLYLTISRVSIILSKFAKLVPSPRPYRSGLVVRPPAWDPRGARGARFDSWCMFKPWCFWGGAKAFSAGKIDLPQNYIRGPRILMILGHFWWFWMNFHNFLIALFITDFHIALFITDFLIASFITDFHLRLDLSSETRIVVWD